MGELCLRHLKTLKQQLDDDGFDIPTEIITDEIVSRLPVKSILKVRSVSKPWLSRISDPSFTKLQLTRGSTAFFIPVVDRHTRKLHIFSANDHGGSLTHLMEIHPIKLDLMLVEMKHVNGLVLLTHLNDYEAIDVNPSTRKMLKLDYGTYATSKHVKYFFGFDESTNEHKILRMRGFGSTPTIEIIGLSRSNYSWRKIDASFDISPNKWSRDIRGNARGNVCVNSVIHILLRRTVELLAFDLRTETFSIVKVPPPYDKPETNYRTSPYLVRINGCIGLVPSYCLVKTKEMHICILKDYENHVWVKETIVFPESWKGVVHPIQDYVSMGEIIFAPKNLCNGIRAPIYNMKSRSFKSVSFTLDHPGLTDLRVYQIKCYIESIVPLLAT
ncbi:F-box protein DOR-like [Bidens hawaiensis]|uniref:F-box protein DOR-like n=1 Tax=Bidens hawaiensis TaxID=980011 RepID=UPI004049869B